MDEGELKKEAMRFFDEAYQHQMKGDLERAEALYKRSLETLPTAEAYTFLGWTYSFMGRLDEAIEECHKAIQVDPDYGNPYNDIGAYLMQGGRLDEAIPWLLRAMEAKRYENPAFPHMNLGRVWEFKGEWFKAIDEYKKALALDPNYSQAAMGLARIRGKLN